MSIKKFYNIARKKLYPLNRSLTGQGVRDTLNIVDRAYIIHNGEIMKSGAPKEIAQDKNVRQVYLGSKFRF